MTAYYNEFDPYAAAWLRNLISAGHIAPGDVDERSIVDVQPDELAGFTQCHFFAGIGGWSLAARLAGWDDDRELWTGSAPCQPYSVAGKGQGQADERDLWPEYFRLIRSRNPSVVMGEQVAAAVGKDWLDRVFVEMEGVGYTCGAAVVPACAVDAPHRRDRLWFVADAGCERGQARLSGPIKRDEGFAGEPDDNCRKSALADAETIGSRAGLRQSFQIENGDGIASGGGTFSLANPNSLGGGQEHQNAGRRGEGSGARKVAGPDSADYGALADANQLGESQRWEQRSGQLVGAGSNSRGSAWVGAEWLAGADGKARRFEPSIRLLAHGVPARVGKLRAYGNAIVPQVAAEIIGAYMDCQP